MYLMNLDLFAEGDVKLRKIKENSQLKILSWNLQSPSLGRAKLQVEYIKSVSCDILVLTELKRGKSFDFYVHTLQKSGYYTHFTSILDTNDYITLIATKGMISKISSYNDISHSEPRIVLIDVYFKLGAISVLGIYMPSFHPLFSKTEVIDRKKSFNKTFLNLLERYFSGPSHRLVLTGDLNILEPGHLPSIRGFEQWNYVYENLLDNSMFDCFRKFNSESREHSWFSNDGIGYRFDHFFCDIRMQDSVRYCYYDHNVRLEKLSDHSAMFLEIF